MGVALVFKHLMIVFSLCNEVLHLCIQGSV